MEIYSDCLPKVYRKQMTKTKTSIKECLQPKQITQLQKLMLDIRNNFILKVNTDKEPGKMCLHVSNLPKNLDPINTSFGIRQRNIFTVANTIYEKYNLDYSMNKNISEERINRKYEKPFSKHKIFGKASSAETDGNKAKKLIYWFTEVPNFQDSDYQLKEYSQSQNFQKKIDKLTNHTSENIYEILHENPENLEIIKLKKCLSHINSIRLQIKKRTSEICFFTLKDHLYRIDKNNSNTVTLNDFYKTLKRVKIHPINKTFEYLLQKLNLIKGELIYFDKALNLLNWKYKFPEISIIDDVPRKCEYYTTTYQDSMKVQKL